MNKNIKVHDRVSAEYAHRHRSALKIKGIYLGTNTSGLAEIETRNGVYRVVPASLRKLVKKKKPETFTTSKDFVFTKTPLGWIDQTSKLEWMNEFKAGLNHYDAEKWATEQKMRLPTREEFIEAESHGIRELPDMVWKGYWFWSSTQYRGYSDSAYEFNGANGYADYDGLRDFSVSYVAARAVCPTNSNKDIS